MTRPRRAVLCAALLVTGHPVAGQVPSPTVPAPRSCTAAEYRQFDFWLGEWNVYEPDGRLAGTNHVTRELGGCVVQEHWAAAAPSSQRGSSFNTWSRSARRWHQTWVDSTAGFLLLDGGLENGAMVLSGRMPAPGGAVVEHRVAWSVLDGGRVRQLWESSSDGGKTWAVVFDGTYVRRK